MNKKKQQLQNNKYPVTKSVPRIFDQPQIYTRETVDVKTI